MVDFDYDERALLIHLINRAFHSYTQSEIDPDLRVGNNIVRWRCGECGNTGPNRSTIVHGSDCFFQRVQTLRAKLLTAQAQSGHPDSPTS